MMRRKILYLCAVGVLTSVLLAGCGDGSEEVQLVQQAVTVESEPLLSETERAICDYELKYNTGTFQMQDYHALADLYQEVGMIRKQRDMLEQSYRLFEDTEALAKLENISVNLAEEDDAVVREAETMFQNLDLPEYLDESVNLISSSRWMRTMMPKLSEGKRSYFLQKDGRTALVIEVGYDENGQPYSDVWYVNDENQLMLLQYDENTVRMLQTTMVDGVYDGAFELWLVDGNNGNIRHEQGTFANGVYTGDYTASIHLGTEGSDLFSLWSHRDTMAYTTYTGHFDEQGRTTLEQPTAENQAALIAGTDKAGCVVYAYDESGSNCLFLGLEEGTDPMSLCFDLATNGLKMYPVIEVYEPMIADADNSASTENGESAGTSAQNGVQAATGSGQNVAGTIPTGTTELQIRIFDGEIQYFNGYRWIDAGNAQEYVKEDPFYAYAEKKEQFENNLWGTAAGSSAVGGENSGDNDGENVGNDDGASINSDKTGNQGMGAIATPTPTPTPAPTKKPVAAKPTVTQQPVVVQTPAPTAPPAASAPVPDDDDDDDDSSASAPAPNPTPAPEPDPTPAPDPEPPADSGGGSDSGSSGDDSGGSDDGSSGDTDIEWSPDIM